MSSVASGAPAIPLAVHIGFAGSRHLVDLAGAEIDYASFETNLVEILVDHLRELPSRLGLAPAHFLAGVSQMAAGGDLVFSEACRRLDISQRVFLPQARSDYVTAIGLDGAPDFAAHDRARAIALLDAPHVIEERVVSTAADRASRFEAVNVAIVAESDVVLALTRAGGSGRPGGSRDLMRRARQRGLPVIELVVSVGEKGQPVVEAHWPGAATVQVAVSVSHELDGLSMPPSPAPDQATYLAAIRKFASSTALRHQALFRRGAFVIIATHTLATILAVTVLLGIERFPVAIVLAIELVLLAIGLWTHYRLHRAHVTRMWALSRLVAEVGRSASVTAAVPGALDHLFAAPMPVGIRPLLRTINVLHLQRHAAAHATLQPAAPNGIAGWEVARDRYVAERFDDPLTGQRAYYTRQREWSRVRFQWATRTFYVMSSSALAVTGVKLVKSLLALSTAAQTSEAVDGAMRVTEAAHSPLTSALAMGAIVLPVMAVAAMSLAAGFDLEARLHTYEEMVRFLESQRRWLAEATTEFEFASLVRETESRLLGESVTWYSRRVFTGVA